MTSFITPFTAPGGIPGSSSTVGDYNGSIKAPTANGKWMPVGGTSRARALPYGYPISSRLSVRDCVKIGYVKGAGAGTSEPRIYCSIGKGQDAPDLESTRRIVFGQLRGITLRKDRG